MIINRASKSTGKYKMWMNIQLVADIDVEETQDTIDFDKTRWKHKERSVMLSQIFNHNIMQAKGREIRNLTDSDVLR